MGCTALHRQPIPDGTGIPDRVLVTFPGCVLVVRATSTARATWHLRYHIDVCIAACSVRYPVATDRWCAPRVGGNRGCCGLPDELGAVDEAPRWVVAHTC